MQMRLIIMLLSRPNIFISLFSRWTTKQHSRLWHGAEEVIQPKFLDRIFIQTDKPVYRQDQRGTVSKITIDSQVHAPIMMRAIKM